MPKLGMGPVQARADLPRRSEGNFRAGLRRHDHADGREEAGVSTGMLNHYFANRMEMLEETLLFVSMRQQARESAAIEGLEPGEARLRALVRSALPTTQESMEAWRVWIAGHGASVRLPGLSRVDGVPQRVVVQDHRARTRGGCPPVKREKVPYVWHSTR